MNVAAECQGMLFECEISVYDYAKNLD